MRFKLYASVDRGLEQVVIKDLREQFGISASTDGHRAKVFFEGDAELIPLLNFSCRSINRVVILLSRAEVVDLADVHKLVMSIDWGEYIDRGQTFAVEVKRVGEHYFTSYEVKSVAADALIESVKRNYGWEPQVDLRSPDVTVRVEVIGRECIIGIDTTGPSLHMRRYRAWNHPLPLKTTLAYLMVKLSKWNEKEILVDPMCGGGTVLIEAAHKARRTPICKFRLEEYAFWRLKFIDREHARKLAEKLLSQEIAIPLNLFGSDIDPRCVEGAKMNAEKAGVSDTVKLRVWDARKIDELYGESSIDCIVTNPPYKLYDRTYLSDLYEKFVKAAKKVLTDGGRLVAITSEIGLMARALRKAGFTYESLSTFRYGRTPCRIFIAQK